MEKMHATTFVDLVNMAGRLGISTATRSLADRIGPAPEAQGMEKPNVAPGPSLGIAHSCPL